MEMVQIHWLVSSALEQSGGRLPSHRFSIGSDDTIGFEQAISG
jgi:hypothetical protein